MRLYAISDLHIGYKENRKLLEGLSSYPEDWLIIAGDVGESCVQLAYAFELLSRRFAKLIWVPGNHELWKWQKDGNLYGEAKYHTMVNICRKMNVTTPEDPYLLWTGPGGDHLIAPLFLLYDYTFCPSHIAQQDAVRWAAESGVVCGDEDLLVSYPYPSLVEWCQNRCAWTRRRLQAAIERYSCPLILINHFPLKKCLVWLPSIPRFSIWCGTKMTEDWHRRFNARVVVSGHLHIRRTDWIDQVRFEEVSLGYPERQWEQGNGLDFYLRQILPEPSSFAYTRRPLSS